ncbi:sensor histidine kinase [Salinactinospora qingdaonensis]|uniref:histidine kinase n=1 Tax=Salinactinospora qingdaonensis TaxID=702744 RepID=A0ABP7GBY3_9ACTN
MSADVSNRKQSQFSPKERALLVFLVVTVLTAAVWIWAALAAPAAARTLVTIGGGTAAVMLSAALAVAVYYAETTRRAREEIRRLDAHATHLEQEARHLSEEALPVLSSRLREGASAEAALSAVAQPSHETLRALLRGVSYELDAAERKSRSALETRSAMEEELSHIATETLPTLIRRASAERVSPETALAKMTPPQHEALHVLLSAMARELTSAERKGAAAMTACASAAARVQAQVTSMLARLRELEERYGDQEGIFGELLELDHRVSQMGRLADSFALLSGGRSGRRWTKPIVMESILRGAMGRIGAYRRVRTHLTSTAAVAGYAAEGVMHALAELMDNATSFSAHGTEVHVYVEEEDPGIAVTIEDSGLGMRTRERRRAEKMVSEPMDLTTMSGTRLGLAVVGRLARKYGLKVSFRPSSRGGTGVVVLIPRQLITQPRHEPRGAVPTPSALSAPPQQTEESHRQQVPDSRSEGDKLDTLPKRRRGETLAAAARAMSAPAAEPKQKRRDPAARFAAFRQSGARSRDDSAPPNEGSR